MGWKDLANSAMRLGAFAFFQRKKAAGSRLVRRSYRNGTQFVGE